MTDLPQADSPTHVVVLDAPTPTGSNNTILWVVGGVVCVAVLCSITYLGGRSGDHTQLITTILGFAGTFMTALIAVIKSNQNNAAIKQLHLAVNGRLTQLINSMTANAALTATNTALTSQAEKTSTAVVDPVTGAVAVTLPIVTKVVVKPVTNEANVPASSQSQSS